VLPIAAQTTEQHAVSGEKWKPRMAGANLNKSCLIGRIGADLELKKTQNSSVVNMSVATSRRWKDDSGAMQEDTQWHRVTVWGRTAENCADFLRKGSQVYVEGRIETRSYDKDGEKRYVTEIVAHTVQFLDSKDSNQSSGRVDDQRRGSDHGGGRDGGRDRDAGRDSRSGQRDSRQSRQNPPDDLPF